MKSIRILSPAVVTWLAASIVAALSCSLYYPAAHLDGEYLPVGNDSFYHARRILDTVADPGSFYEFDAKIHAPEGSLLVWPWGYDYVMAQIVRLGMAVGLSQDPMAILVWIPVASVFVSMGLLVLLARGLSLSSWPTALAAACMALAPTTQFLQSVGQIDHHYAEMIIILAMLAAGLKWLREPDNRAAAAILALVFGIAPAIHNGTFIVQLPLLFALFVRWTQGLYNPRRTALVFAATLLAATTAVLIPSTAFRTLRFEFYTLSWFHLYIAFCTAATVVLLSVLQRSAKNFLVLAVCGAALLLPILGQIEMAHSFISGSMKWLNNIAEMKSPLREAFSFEGAMIISNLYSLLIWLAPATFLLACVQCWCERATPRLLFWLSAAAGLALLSSQIRMHYFGDFALYLPWLIVASDHARRHPHLAKRLLLSVSLALLLMYYPVLRYQIAAPVSPANDRTFKDTRPVFAALRKACAEDPGIVLADGNAGHYIRYYTNCSVMADNFLLTPLHFRKMDEVEKLFAGSAQELLTSAPRVKYVLLRPLDIRRADDPKQGYKYWFFFSGTPRLAADLLLGSVKGVPSEYTLLDEIRFPEASNIPYARLYKINRVAGPGAPANPRVGE